MEMPPLTKPPGLLDELRAEMAGRSGRELWRSLDEWLDSARFEQLLRTELPDVLRLGGMDRRTFLKTLGAAFALGGLAACKPREAPLLSRPRDTLEHTPGVPLIFATSLEHDGHGHGVLVRSNDGWATQIDGNPQHPATVGAVSVFDQGMLHGLYDPERSANVLQRGVRSSWAAFDRYLRSARADLEVIGGRGLHLLTGPLSSPFLLDQLARLRERMPQIQWHVHSPLHSGVARRAARQAFGVALEPVYDLTRAEVIVTVDADLFMHMPGHLRYARDFAMARRERLAAAPPAAPPRLYAIESTPTLAGARADRRIVLPPPGIPAFVGALAAAVLNGRSEDAEGVSDGASSSSAVSGDGSSSEVDRLAARLRAAGARGLVIAGERQPIEVHALAHRINAAIGALGNTVRMIPPVTAGAEAGAGSIVELADAMARGAVTHLVMLGVNPVYDAPGDLRFIELLRRVPNTVHLDLQVNETAQQAGWHLPQRHPLESWGDVRAFDGTISLRQPVIAPSLDARSIEELLVALVDGSGINDPALRDGTRGIRDALRGFWQAQWQLQGETFEQRWREVLDAGLVEGSAFEAQNVAIRMSDGIASSVSTNANDRTGGAMPGSPPLPDGFTVAFAPSDTLRDGRLANNPWLQELPQPLTKLVWGNAALISPADARAMNLTNGDVLRIAVSGRALEAPVWILPGQAPRTVTLPLGYGRTQGGRFAADVGFDAYRLRLAGTPWTMTGATLTKVGRREPLITTQQHHTMAGRELVKIVSSHDPRLREPPRERADLQIEGADPRNPRPPIEPCASAYPQWEYPSHAWAMVIDLDACLGCNACVLACQVENNVPAVGPREVARGREMHWLRIDRYYEGEPEDPRTYFQPIPCMHCEMAPCEVACPVNATVHSSEGLNQMVYSRCIGTRACSNYCPYNVRRFNWFDYGTGPYAPPEPMRNPEVPVRLGGVMEKCTFCVQRIVAGRIEARMQDRPLADGEVNTACAEACPTRAIRFGDLNDARSEVRRLRASPRHYELLGELNTRPRTTYLARVESPAVPPAEARDERPRGR